MSRIFIDSPPEFVPPTSGLIDFSEVDALLVSNYHSILALPFITNGTGFKGVVYMTEPTMQIGRCVHCLQVLQGNNQEELSGSLMLRDAAYTDDKQV